MAQNWKSMLENWAKTLSVISTQWIELRTNLRFLSNFENLVKVAFSQKISWCPSYLQSTVPNHCPHFFSLHKKIRGNTSGQLFGTKFWRYGKRPNIFWKNWSWIHRWHRGDPWERGGQAAQRCLLKQTFPLWACQ